MLVVLVVFLASIDGAEEAAVGDESLVLGWESLISFQNAGEGPFGAVCKVGFSIQGNEVGKAVVKRVPEVTNDTSLLSRHAEAVLVGGEVSNDVLVED